MTDSYSYEYDFDKLYCYPNSNVLKNKLNIKDKKLFSKAERKITALRTAQALVHPIKGKYDFKHLKDIHKFLFSDIYTWAGKVRTVNISKGNPFCQALYIEDEIENVFKKLKEEKFLDNLKNDKEQLAKRLAYYISEINAVHPFREGNGRTQRLFITYLARRQGYDLQFSNIEPKEMINASYDSFAGDYDAMNKLMQKCLVPYIFTLES